MSVLGVLPARLQSTRLPRKLLLSETGKTVLQHTWEAAVRCQTLDELVIATDSTEIAEVARKFGAQVVMTGECANGTDRAARVLELHPGDHEIIVNIQGDEPEIDPDHIDQCVKGLLSHPECEMSTLANPITSIDQLNSPSCVKVVRATNGLAMYFSRASIPHSRDLAAEIWLEEASPYQPPPWLQHIGLYAYRRPFLQAFVKMPPSALEVIEQLEQLRALQAGAAIYVGVVSHRAAGIDTPQDYQEFVQRYRNGI